MAVYSASVRVRSRWAILNFAFDVPDPIPYAKWIITDDEAVINENTTDTSRFRGCYVGIKGTQLTVQRWPRPADVFPEILVQMSIVSDYQYAALVIKQSPDDLLGVVAVFNDKEYPLFHQADEQVLIELHGFEASSMKLDKPRIEEFSRGIDVEATLAKGWKALAYSPDQVTGSPANRVSS